MNKIYLYLPLSIAILLCSQSKSFAQQMSKKALDKASWYSAPREFQIIDDRPVVKDFRETPQPEQTVDLGPALRAHAGQPSVRTDSDNLPKAGFGSNVPARGLTPATALPSAGLRSYSKSMSVPAAGRPPVAGNRGTSNTARSTPTVARSYGGYKTAPTNTSNTTSEELNVRGKLLRSK